MSGTSLSHLLHVEKKVCDQWLKNFKRTYSDFTAWAEKISMIAEARGWINNSDGRVNI